MKRAFSVLVCAAMIFSLTACGEASVSDEKDAAEGDAAASGKLAVITGTGGLGDQNLNDYVYSGVKMHESEGVTVDVVRPLIWRTSQSADAVCRRRNVQHHCLHWI